MYKVEFNYAITEAVLEEAKDQDTYDSDAHESACQLPYRLG